MTDKQRTRQEVFESLMRRYANIRFGGVPVFGKNSVRKLNEVYSLNLSGEGLEDSGCSIGFYECLNGGRHYGNLTKGSFPMYRTGFEPSKLIANLIHGRKLGIEEDRKYSLPNAVKIMADTHKIGGVESGPDYAIDVFSDKVRHRSLSKDEYEAQLTGHMTGGTDMPQIRLLALYLEFKRNGASFRKDKSGKLDYGFRERKPTKEITESEWARYKRIRLNPDYKPGIFSKLASYFK